MTYPPFPADGYAAAWERLDADGTEELTVAWENEAWTASGVVGHEHVQYVLRLSPSWQVRQFLLFRDLDEPDLWLATDMHGRWGEVNGAHRTDLDGCTELHLDCTPFTTALAIRRLPLGVGDTAEVSVATIDVESLAVLPEHQRFTRLDTHRWRHDRPHLPSVTFDVDQHGVVLDYAPRFARRR
jgi:hypothetical protein